MVVRWPYIKHKSLQPHNYTIDRWIRFQFHRFAVCIWASARIWFGFGCAFRFVKCVCLAIDACVVLSVRSISVMYVNSRFFAHRGCALVRVHVYQRMCEVNSSNQNKNQTQQPAATNQTKATKRNLSQRETRVDAQKAHSIVWYFSSIIYYRTNICTFFFKYTAFWQYQHSFTRSIL